MSSDAPKSNPPGVLRNWNDTATSAPRVVVRPKDVDELARVVRDSETYPSPLRTAGSFHSMNACFSSSGAQILLSEFTDIQVDVTNHSVTVGAYVTMLQIRNALRPHNLRIEVQPEIGNATAGSVACCGTKDASIGPTGLGQISSTVLAVRMVDAEGNVVAYNETDHPEKMREIRSSNGLFGILFEVTFRTLPDVYLHYKPKVIHLDPLPEFDALLGDSDGYLAFMLPYLKRIGVERRTVSSEQSPPSWFSRLKCRIRGYAWAHLSSLFSSILPYNWFYALFDRWVAASIQFMSDLGGFRAHRSDSMIDFKFNRSHYFDFTFWAFPASAWPKLIPDYFDLCASFQKETGFRSNLPSEVYLVRQDQNALLSYSSEGPIFTLDLADSRPHDPNWHELNRRFNQLAIQHGGRPVFNQTKELTAEVARTAYGEDWERFKELRRQADPENRFLNQYFADLL